MSEDLFDVQRTSLRLQLKSTKNRLGAAYLVVSMNMNLLNSQGEIPPKERIELYRNLTGAIVECLSSMNSLMESKGDK